jgi:hydrogenase nickel incorporation protein HypA/HybF
VHEFSIALNIIEIAEQEAKKAGASEVTSVEIEVGQLSGVIIEALEFAFESAIKDTILRNASIHLITIPGKARCNHCGQISEAENLFDPCKNCGEFNVSIIAGRELAVKSITVS